MNIVVVGSAALEHHINTVVIGKDIDYIMTYADYKLFLGMLKTSYIGTDAIHHYPIDNGKKMVVKTHKSIYEIEIAWPDSTAEEFLNLVLADNHTTRIGHRLFPSLDGLYAMKMSHRYLKNSPHFLKTLKHIKLIRSTWGVTRDTDDVVGYWNDWYSLRMNETYSYTHPNLDVNKQSFFQDEAFYKYDHDDIHEAVKLDEKPAYKRILADGSPVKCDKQKFLELSPGNKLNCALEECYTLALERSLIPNEFRPDPKKAFEMALMKICTSVTSGWFRAWCWENYEHIAASYQPIYVPKFHMHLAAGLIRPFNHDRNYK